MLHAPTGEKQPHISPSSAHQLRQTPTFRATRNQPEIPPAHMQQREYWANLQKTYGNQAILRALGAQSPQAKLTVGTPNDQYEQEADRVAEQVMRMPDSTASNQGDSPLSPDPQALTAPLIQPQTRSGSTVEVSPSLTADIASAKNGGQPLAHSARDFFEPRFGQDFSDVRVHPDFQRSQDLKAQAFTTGQDIFFDQGQYNSDTTTGQKLLAHELTHVVQQGGESSGKVIQRQYNDAWYGYEEEPQTPLLEESEEDWWYEIGSTRASKVTFQQTIHNPNPSPFLPSMPLWQVVATPSEGWIMYKALYTIKLRVNPNVISDRIPFAYQITPPVPVNTFPRRDYPIIHIIAARGVSIQLEGFPNFYALTPNNTIPRIEIIRVQSLNQVPLIGTKFNLSDYTSLKAVESPIKRSEQQVRQSFGLPPLPPLPPDIAVHQHPDGLDVVQVSSKEVLRIRTPNLRGDTAFAYEVIPEQLTKESPMKRVIVKLIKTPAVEVALHTPFFDLRAPGARGLLVGIIPIVYEVDSVRDVPAQGLPIPKKGRKVNVKHEMQESLSRIVATSAIDTVIGFVPIAGDFVDIAELAYGIFSGYDRWGRLLSIGDLVLMGIGALLPFVGSGALKGTSKLSKALNRNAEEVADLIRAAQSLSDAERKSVEDWTDLIRRGGQIPDTDVKKAISVVKKMDTALKKSKSLAGKGKAATREARGEVRTPKSSKLEAKQQSLPELLHGKGLKEPDVEAYLERVKPHGGVNAKALRRILADMTPAQTQQLLEFLEHRDLPFTSELEVFIQHSPDLNTALFRLENALDDAALVGTTRTAAAAADVPLRSRSAAIEDAIKGSEHHVRRADERRISREWDFVNEKLVRKDGKPIRVPKKYDKSGKPAPDTEYKAAQPDAVSITRQEILDDKPFGNDPLKYRDQMIGYIRAYQQMTGELPKKIIIQWYSLLTGELMTPSIFPPTFFLP